MNGQQLPGEVHVLAIFYETSYAQHKATEETCTAVPVVLTHKLPRNHYDEPTQRETLSFSQLK